MWNDQSTSSTPPELRLNLIELILCLMVHFTQRSCKILKVQDSSLEFLHHQKIWQVMQQHFHQITSQKWNDMNIQTSNQTV